MYRSIVLALLTTVVTVTAADAQSFYFGALGGVNVADIEVDVEGLPDIDLFEPRTLPAIGAVLEFGFGDHLAIRIEPMYIRKGARVENPLFELADFELVDVSGEVDLRYFEVPVHLNIGLLGGPVQPYVLIGPSFGLLFEARVVNELLGEE